jgi:hypothetical protein
MDKTLIAYKTGLSNFVSIVIIPDYDQQLQHFCINGILDK